MEENARNYLYSKAQHLSGLKRKADATAIAAIPLTTTHGGHPLHVQILSHATVRPLEELTAKQKKRRTLQQLISGSFRHPFLLSLHHSLNSHRGVYDIRAAERTADSPCATCHALIPQQQRDELPLLRQQTPHSRKNLQLPLHIHSFIPQSQLHFE